MCRKPWCRLTPVSHHPTGQGVLLGPVFFQVHWTEKALKLTDKVKDDLALKPGWEEGQEATWVGASL